MELWIGTSGYVYADWVGPFYPPKTSSAAMLSYYARHFPLVELNFTYYRLPTSHQLAGMVRRVPSDFQFIVKAHRSLTHERDPEQIDAFRNSLEPMHEKGQLLGVLCQYPQSFHCNAANQRWLSSVHEQMPGFAISVEFRHHSWDRPEINDWLRDKGMCLVSVDVPDIPSLYPRKLVQSGRRIYVRFHSRRAEHWYAAGHSRYDYAYSDEELLNWLRALARRSEETDVALLLFNNCWHAQAIANAQRIHSLLDQMKHPFRIITSSHSETQQGTLF